MNPKALLYVQLINKILFRKLKILDKILELIKFTVQFVYKFIYELISYN
jgi:hypothetical protein